MKKKLTHTGGAPMVFTVIAFIFSIIGAAALPVINALRESKFDSVFVDLTQYDETYQNIVNYLYVNFEAVGMFLLCLIALFMLGSSARKKKTASGMAVLLMFSAIAVSMYSIAYLAMRGISGTWEKMFEWSDDESFFDMIANLVLVFAPLCAALFLILASFSILFRLAGETNTVEIRSAKKAILYPPQELSAPIPVPAAAPDMEPVMQNATYPAMAQVADATAEQVPEEFFPEMKTPEPEINQPAEEPENEPEKAPEAPEPVLPEEPVAPVTQESQGFCPGCGAAVTDSMKFCNTCGIKLK